MIDATETSAVKGFSADLNRIAASLKKSLTHDQRCEMTRYAEITRKTGSAIYFYDRFSPLQRGSNENINGFIRQYLPKETERSRHNQEQLDAIASELNILSLHRFNYRSHLKQPCSCFYGAELLKYIQT